MKILVVTLSNLGDVVLTLPVFASLRQANPDACLDVVVGASGKNVFEGDKRIRQLTVYDRKMGWSARAALLSRIRAERYDLIVDLRYSFIGLFGGARKRNAYLLSLSRHGHRGAKHLLALKGITAVRAAESWLKDIRAGADIPLPGGRIVVAAVGSKSDLKKWPAEKYAEVLDRLAAEKDCSIVLVGDAHEKNDAEAVRRAMRAPVTDLTGRTDLAQLAGVLRRASLVLTNDSAPLHIADSLKAPVLAIFGPTDPRKYGPRQAQSAVVARTLHCQPCEQAQCRYGHQDCLKGLEAGEVYAKAAQILDSRTRAGNHRVLVIRLDRIGDVMLSVPAIEALRTRYPQSRIDVMTRTETRPLLSGHPAVDEVIAYDYKKGKHAFPLGYFRFLEEIQKRRYDAAVILHPGVRSYLLPFLAGIPARIGYKTGPSWLLTRALPDRRHEGQKHESEYALDLVEALTGSRERETRPVPRPKAGGLIAVHPGASCPSKRWPKENFRTLIETLLLEYPDRKIVLIGGRETQADAESIGERLEQVVENTAGRLSLPQLVAKLAECELLISNDSGPVHIAAAQGCRVISLFGRNQAGLSAARWRPLGEGHTVLQKDVGCQVCLAHECTIGFECLKAIHVEDVMNAVRKMIGSGQIVFSR